MSRNDRFEVEASKISQDFLEDIGLGRDAPLLHEPKLFLEGPFLSALLFEFDRDLRPEVADQALFAIGASHGARAAEGILQQVLANTPYIPKSQVRVCYFKSLWGNCCYFFSHERIILKRG